MECKKFQKGAIVYITKVECVDIDTGEILQLRLKEFKEKYKIINKIVNVKYGYLTKTTETQWQGVQKPKQMHLNLV